jgi:predicted peptidase
MKQKEMVFPSGGASGKGPSFEYLLYLPPEYGDPVAPEWPLILFLHGAGERGGDLDMVTRNGIPRIVEEWDRFPAITLSPQCSRYSYWDEYLESLNELLDQTEKSYAVDPGRIYLTGISMGGYGCWHLAALYPHRFAALVPICGGGSSRFGFPRKARVLRDVPIWVFHGARDEIVPSRESQVLVDELKRVGGNVRLTLYPDCGHDAWNRTYADPGLYRWLLDQKRPD